LVITEGTRIDSDSRDSERDVEESIRQLVSDCSGLAIIDFGWKDTTRFETILSVARATGRTLAINPKVALLWEYLRTIDSDRYHDLAADPNVRVYLERRNSLLYSLADYTDGKYIVGVNPDWGERAQEMKRAWAAQDQDYLATRLRHYGSGVRAYDIAAEPKRYILHAGYFEMNELFDIEPPRGSIFVRAATEPFSDEMRLDEKRLANWLTHFGLLTDGDKVVHHHVSGHASGDDLCQFLQDMEPKAIIPVHTTNPKAYVDFFADICDVIVPIKGQDIIVP
jgi:ribonuclease J